MSKFPKALQAKLDARKENYAFRILSGEQNKIDFSSNDYLGFAKSESIFNQTQQLLHDKNITTNGATGSRLISGNHNLYPETENAIAKFHYAESALIFNSGYDANVGFFSSVPQRNDIVLFDELCHASIRDGIRLSNAKSYKFIHNDFEDLENLIQKHQTENEIFIATESVFSMDGDSPNLEQMAALAEKHNCLLVIDEAHALGIFGNNGAGLVQELNLQNKVFARIMTFGKGLGCHGAAVLGSQELSDYLINFARSFIYTTGLPPHSLASIFTAYKYLETESKSLEKLKDNMLHFNQEKNRLGIKQIFVRSKSAIQSAIIPGNEKVKDIASQLQSKGFDVKAILSPTVPEGQERLRICLHSYNSAEEITNVLRSIQELIF